MREAEARGLPYLFKLRLTANVKRMIEKLAGAREWVCAGQGFEAKESAVRLTGWSRERRVIVLRRRLKGALGLAQSDEDGTPQLSFTEIGEATEVYGIFRFWSPRSRKKLKRSASSIAIAAMEKIFSNGATCRTSERVGSRTNEQS